MYLCNSGEWGRSSEGEEVKVWDLLNKADFKPTVTLQKGECLLPLQSPENSYLLDGGSVCAGVGGFWRPLFWETTAGHTERA